MSEYYKWNNDFSKVYLEDSYVLEVKENTNAIEFLMEFVLTEKHPDYAPPKPNEQYCYKKGEIIFSNIKHINWIEQSFNPIEDADGEIDYGNIDSFVFEDGKYHLEGEWGEVLIESDTPKIIF